MKIMRDSSPVSLLAGACLAIFVAVSCSSGGGSNNGGSGGSEAGSTGSKGGSGGSKTTGKTGGTSGTGNGVTYEKDAKPIFAAKCSPCHTSTGTAKIFHTMASVYPTALKDAVVCPGKKKGECALERIKKGEMPQSAGCTGNPDTDSANPKCLTQEEQDTLQAWIDGGLVER